MDLNLKPMNIIDRYRLMNDLILVNKKHGLNDISQHGIASVNNMDSIRHLAVKINNYTKLRKYSCGLEKITIQSKMNKT